MQQFQVNQVSEGLDNRFHGKMCSEIKVGLAMTEWVHPRRQTLEVYIVAWVEALLDEKLKVSNSFSDVKFRPEQLLDFELDFAVIPVVVLQSQHLYPFAEVQDEPVLQVHHLVSRYNWLGRTHIHHQDQRESNRDQKYQRPQAANLRRKKAPRLSASYSRIVPEHDYLDGPIVSYLLASSRLLCRNFHLCTKRVFALLRIAQKYISSRIHLRINAL